MLHSGETRPQRDLSNDRRGGRGAAGSADLRKLWHLLPRPYKLLQTMVAAAAEGVRVDQQAHRSAPQRWATIIIIYYAIKQHIKYNRA